MLDIPSDSLMLEQIHEGRWSELIARSSGQGLSYSLIAAYSKGEIDLEDVATGMIFNRTLHNAGAENCQIIPICKETLDTMGNLEEQDKEAILAAASRAKPNQRFILMVNKTAFDFYTQNVMYHSFLKEGSPQIFGFLQSGEGEKTQYGMLGFGVCKAHYPNLAPVIHVTPSLKKLGEHIKMGKSDFMLQFPDDVNVIHGSQDRLFFAQVHDLFHTRGRTAFGPIIVKDMIDLIFDVKVDARVRKSYNQKMDPVHSVYPRFVEMPSEEEMVAYLLDRITGEIMDASYKITIDRSCLFDAPEIALKGVVKGVFDREFRLLESKFPSASFEAWQQGVKKRVVAQLPIHTLY